MFKMRTQCTWWSGWSLYTCQCPPACAQGFLYKWRTEGSQKYMTTTCCAGGWLTLQLYILYAFILAMNRKKKHCHIWKYMCNIKCVHNVTCLNSRCFILTNQKKMELLLECNRKCKCKCLAFFRWYFKVKWTLAMVAYISGYWCKLLG